MVKRGALIEDERMIVIRRLSILELPNRACVLASTQGRLGGLNRRNCLRAPSARL